MMDVLQLYVTALLWMDSVVIRKISLSPPARCTVCFRLRKPPCIKALAFPGVRCESSMCCYSANTVLIICWNVILKLTTILNVALDVLLGPTGCKGLQSTNNIFTKFCCTDPMHRLSLKHVMKAKQIRKMILFARKLNNSIKSGGVAVCSQLKPRLNNFCGKGKKVFFSAGSKLPCLYF